MKYNASARLKRDRRNDKKGRRLFAAWTDLLGGYSEGQKEVRELLVELLGEGHPVLKELDKRERLVVDRMIAVDLRRVAEIAGLNESAIRKMLDARDRLESIRIGEEVLPKKVYWTQLPVPPEALGGYAGFDAIRAAVVGRQSKEAIIQLVFNRMGRTLTGRVSKAVAMEAESRVVALGNGREYKGQEWQRMLFGRCALKVYFENCVAPETRVSNKTLPRDMVKGIREEVERRLAVGSDGYEGDSISSWFDPRKWRVISMRDRNDPFRLMAYLSEIIDAMDKQECELREAGVGCLGDVAKALAVAEEKQGRGFSR